MTDEMEATMHTALRASLESGQSILAAGGSAMDAVEAAVVSMEDCQHFNAGRGSVFTADECHEMEASIMDGRNLKCGSVMMINSLKNPIRAARLMMEKTPHVSLSGMPAEKLATQLGLEVQPPSYFHTDRRWKALQKVKAISNQVEIEEEDKHGTVGAVAMDTHGNIATATSTGGTTNKLPGRIGDTPMIGAGTWADNQSCGVSTTGQGEYFMRLAAARDIAALIEYKGLSIEEAAKIVIHEKLGLLGGNGGIVGIDHMCNVAMVFNSEGMYRGWADVDNTHTSIY